jgi:hypothetical protein
MGSVRRVRGCAVIRTKEQSRDRKGVVGKVRLVYAGSRGGVDGDNRMDRELIMLKDLRGPQVNSE